MNILASTDNSPRIEERCTGCGRCVAVCRYGALDLETERPNGFGRKRAVAAARHCTACRDCLLACPFKALSFESTK